VVQVKKAHVREAILRSADRLFKRNGYVSATTAQIATGANISVSNLYVYFGSKLSILMALYEPWLRARIHRLEGRLERETDVRRRLQLILNALWRDLPSADNGFTNNLMQALTTVSRREGYRPDLLHWVEGRIESLILSSLPPPRRRELARRGLAHMLMMAQDGFAMNFHLTPPDAGLDALIDLACDLIMGTPARAGQRKNETNSGLTHFRAISSLRTKTAPTDGRVRGRSR
jgi:AcrR family transcriptional regulator